jgi:predicted dehydrogenase
MGGEPTWGIWQDKKIKNTCGGALLDLLIHDIDFANYCLGSPQTVKLNLNKDDYWEFELKYHGESAKVSVKGGFLYRHTVFASEYVATFEKGSIRYSSLQPQIIHIGIDTGAEIIKVKGDAYYAELEYFTKCCETRMVPTKCLPEDSLKAIKTCRQI